MSCAGTEHSMNTLRMSVTLSSMHIVLFPTNLLAEGTVRQLCSHQPPAMYSDQRTITPADPLPSYLKLGSSNVGRI